MATLQDIYTLPREIGRTTAASRSAPALVVFVFAALLVLNVPIDPDSWWHLRTGQAILTTGNLPDYPILSPSTTPWMLHEWGSEVLGWVLFDVGGWLALGLAVAVAVGAGWAGLVASHRHPLRRTVAMWLAVVAVLASAPMLGVRPQMVTLVGLALFLGVLEYWRAESATADWLWLAVLPVSMVAWANMHSGFVVGLVVLAIYATADAWRGSWALASVWCATAVASLINPYGIKLWLYPLETLGSESMRLYIAEWLPPSPQVAQYWPFYVLFVVSVAILARNAEQVTAETWLILGGAMLAGLFSLRHIPLAGVAAVALLPRHWPAGWVPPRPTAGHALALLFSASLVAPALVHRMEQSEATVYPVAAVDYLAANGAGLAPLFNEYDWGGYLVWRGFTPAIDGRADVYGERVASTAHARRGRAGWQDEVAGYNLALLRPSTPLVQLLQATGWEKVYSDEMAVIYRRK